ncbi:unnamed protein product [Camellia sinensis]
MDFGYPQNLSPNILKFYITHEGVHSPFSSKAEFLAKHYHQRTIYIPQPTWGNHPKIFTIGGLSVKTYSYYDPATRGLNFQGLLDDLSSAPSGAIVLLHACAHNPTGVDPTLEQWEQIRKLMRSKGLLPFFDSAYQGFASGSLDADAQSVRMFVADGGECLDDTSMLIHSPSSGIMLSQDEYNLHGVEGMHKADIGSKGVARISNSGIDGIGSLCRTISSSELSKQGKPGSLFHVPKIWYTLGIPDFAEVYSFMGSVFDPDTQGHVQKLKEMDPINFETALLLMRNRTINLSSPDFEPIVLSSYDVNSKTVGIATGNVMKNQEK